MIYKFSRRIFFRLIAPLYVACNKRYLAIPRVQFVYFHHLFDNEVIGFYSFLEQAKKVYTVISTREALERLRTGNVDRPYLALSSDDGFESNILASKILNEYGIKACFFVPTGFIGENKCDRSKNVFGFDRMNFCSLEDIQQIISMEHEVGNHTVSHKSLKDMSNLEVIDEIKSANDYFESNEIEIEHFAFPYGSKYHHNIHALNYCTMVGLNYFSAIRGAHTQYPNDNILFRDHVIFGRFNKFEFLFFSIQNAKRLIV